MQKLGLTFHFDKQREINSRGICVYNDTLIIDNRKSETKVNFVRFCIKPNQIFNFNELQLHLGNYFLNKANEKPIKICFQIK